jgi:succinate dehydrogenase / fumarate reductase, cytochrome b subunit
VLEDIMANQDRSPGPPPTFPSNHARGRPNRLGIAGWVGGGRWGYERYLYILHRVSGLGILLYFLLHIFVTASRAMGSAKWTQAMQKVSGPVFEIGEFLVFAAFAFHALNGIRLVLVELGWAVGKPIEPVYPYRTSVGVQRPLAIGIMILAAGLVVVGGVDFFVLR